MKKVVKFGGSSLASAEQFRKVGEIIHADENRKYVVPSAPGKRYDGDTKVTDMLYGCYDLAEKDHDFMKEMTQIEKRYQEIIDGLDLDLDLTREFNTIIDNIKVILERTPPELAADIYRHGVYLTGGASQVSRLAQLMSKGTGLKVNVSENPVSSVALGLAKIIKDDNYKSVAYAIEGMSK